MLKTFGAAVWSVLLLFILMTLTLLQAEKSVFAQEEIVTFAVVGNLGEDNSNHSAVSNMINEWDAEFMLSLGNNRNLGNPYDDVIGKRYCRYLTATSNGPNCTPEPEAANAFYPTLGTQDYLSENGLDAYLEYFDLPGNERYYDFVRGPVHFFALNSNTNEPHGNLANSAQAQWLRIGLSNSTAPWQVIYFHHAPYSSGQKGSYQPMQWPFAEWGADVVLASRDRHYERIERDDVLYFVNGVAESTERLNSVVDGSQLRFRKHFGALKVTASESRLDFEFNSISGFVDKTSLIWTDSRVQPEPIDASEFTPPAGSSVLPPADNSTAVIPPAPATDPALLSRPSVLSCLDNMDECAHPLRPDCVDGGAICLHHDAPGPYNRYANETWVPGTEARYGKLTYVKIDRRRGASVDNLLAGYPNYPKVFCQRPANHLSMGEPAGPSPFIAWSDFNPSLTTPANVTVVQRNGPHLHWMTVPDFAQQPNPDGDYPIFVLNGSFFTPEAAPEGSHWRYGEVQRLSPNRTMLAFSQDGSRAEILWGDGAPIQFGTYKQLKTVICQQNARGELVEVPQPARGVDLSWIYSAIGGGPVFVVPDPNDLDERGQPRVKVAFPGSTEVTTKTVPFNPLGEHFGQASSPYRDEDAFTHRFYIYFAKDNPKSFVCVGDNVVLLGIAQDMSGLELGNSLVELGCHTAMGLDDNSATAFAWRQVYALSPAKRDTFRHVPNAIGVFAKEQWLADEE